MSEPTKSNIVIFKNVNQAPNSKYAPCDYNGFITLAEPLPAGKYCANIYINTSPKGLEYMKGNIRSVPQPKESSPSPKAFDNSYPTPSKQKPDSEEIPF